MESAGHLLQSSIIFDVIYRFSILNVILIICFDFQLAYSSRLYMHLHVYVVVLQDYILLVFIIAYKLCISSSCVWGISNRKILQPYTHTRICKLKHLNTVNLGF